MFLSTYYLRYGHHVARLHRRRRRRRRRRAYAPTSITASHYNHEKINSWAFFCFPYGYGAPLGGPSGQSSAISYLTCKDLVRSGLIKSDPLSHFDKNTNKQTLRVCQYSCSIRWKLLSTFILFNVYNLKSLTTYHVQGCVPFYKDAMWLGAYC